MTNASLVTAQKAGSLSEVETKPRTQAYAGLSSGQGRVLPTAGVDLHGWMVRLDVGVLAVLLLVISWRYFLTSRRARATLHASHELRLSQQRLQYALEGSSLALWDYDVVTGKIYLSEQWSQIVGLEPGDSVITRTEYGKLIHPEDTERVYATLDAVLTNRVTSYQSSYRVSTADGKWRWVRSYGKVVERDADGNPLRMTGTLADITMQQRLQEELHTSENRWRFALEGSGDGVWDWNLVTNEVFFSQRWKEMLGYSEDEITSKLEEWESRVYPDDLEQCYRDLYRHLSHETPVYENEQRVRCKDGSYKWILVRGKVIERDNQDKPLRIIGRHTDISVQRQFQETLRLQARAMEASVDGIIIADATDTNLPIVYCNSAFEHMTGYSSEQVIGRNCLFLQGEGHEQAETELIRSVKKTGGSTTVLRQNYRSDGSLFWNELSVSPVYDDNGRLTHIIGIAKDVTLQVKAREALKRESEFSNATLNAMPGLFFVLDRNGSILRVNRNAENITGYSVTEMDSMNPQELCAEEDRELISDKIAECFHNGEAQCEAHLLTKSGEKLLFYFQAQLYELGGEECLVGSAVDISRLKHMQQELVHSQSLLNTIVEHIPAMVFLKRANDLSYVLLNKAGEEILEYKRDEVLDKTDRDLFSPEQAEAMTAIDRKVLANKQAIVLPESKFRSRSGWMRYMYTVKTALHDEQGSPTHLLGIAIDISERKHTETKLRTSEDQLKLAQRIAQLGHWSLDFVNDRLDWSDEIYRIFGQEYGKYIPSYGNFIALVHPEDLEQVKQSEQRAITEGIPHSLDHRIVRPDGEIRWVHEEAGIIRDDTGKPLKLVGTVQDITSRKLFENTLQYSEARLRSILQTAVDGIIIIDGKGVIESVNPASERLFGYEHGELIGRNVSMLMPQPYRSAHDGYLHRYQATGHANIIGIGREVVGQRKDGSTFPMDLAVSEIYQGERRKFTGFVRDITQRKQFETELLTAKQQAEQASRAKSEFLANMSHELRTPMNAILGFAQLLEAGEPPLAKAQQQDVKEILRAGQHLLELINELLDLARIEAGRMDVSIEPVAVQAVMNECVQMIEPMLLRHQVSLKTDAENARDCIVLADRVRLRQILLNLLSNAIKYNQPGGKVIVQCQALQNDRIQIMVEDTGIGIEPERYPELFNTFSRLGADETATEGTGIGLAITRRLVELMQGEIGVASLPGAGSRFWVELPAADAVVFEAPATTESESVTPGPLTAGRPDYTILYIEDNPANLRFMSQLLARRANMKLITAAEPAEGLELAQTQQPDLILLDIHLPGMDGYEVFSHLQAGAETRHIPVIAISANAMPGDIQRALALGFRKYCTKPININEFLFSLDTILKQ